MHPAEEGTLGTLALMLIVAGVPANSNMASAIDSTMKSSLSFVHCATQMSSARSKCSSSGIAPDTVGRQISVVACESDHTILGVVSLLPNVQFLDVFFNGKQAKSPVYSRCPVLANE